MNKEGNVLLTLTGTSQTSNAINSLLVQLEINLADDRSAVVVDHFAYDVQSAAEKHDVLVLPRPVPLRNDTKAFFSGDGVLAIPHAAPQTLSQDSPLVAPILLAPDTAYRYNPREEEDGLEQHVTATGSQLALVSAMQARNSARLTVLGSVESLSDEWFSASVKKAGEKAASKTANRDFAKQLTAWTFKEVGVLKVNRIEHFLAEEEEEGVVNLNPTMYRVKNNIVRLAFRTGGRRAPRRNANEQTK